MASKLQFRLAVDSRWSVDALEANGDCFYSACAKAFGEQSTVATVSALRAVVAAALTVEQFEIYRACEAAGLEDYAWMRSVATLGELQRRTRRSGVDVGPAKSVWADEFAIRTLASHFSASFLILDEQSCRGGRRRGGGRASSSSDVAHSFISGTAASSIVQFVILQRTRREHYNVARCDEQRAFLFHELPPRAKAWWRTSTVGRPPSPRLLSGEGGGEASSGVESSGGGGGEPARASGRHPNGRGSKRGAAAATAAAKDAPPPRTKRRRGGRGGSTSVSDAVVAIASDALAQTYESTTKYN